ncbi:MAG: hypothetical protein AB1846_05270 [Chloroflexota bacterium]
MYTLAGDEKAVTLMLYTVHGVIRADVVARLNVRVNIWLRTDSAPKYFHLLKPNIILLGAGQVKSFNQPEMYLPTAMVLAYHLVPPHTEALDYEPGEANRTAQPVTANLGSFFFKGEARISCQTEFGTTLEVARTPWMSLYNVDISNLFLPQLRMRVPMMLANPYQVGFAMG